MKTDLKRKKEINLHNLADAVLDIGSEGEGGIGRKIADPDALGDYLNRFLRHDAHPR